MSRSTRWCLMSVVLFGAAFAPAQQPNSAAASMTFFGVDGAPFPLTVTAFPSLTPSMPITVSGAAAQPFSLYHAPAGTTTPGLGTPFGVADLDFSGGVVTLMDGFTFSTGSVFDLFANTAGGSQTIQFQIPPGLFGSLGGFQAAVASPGAPSGIELTAATKVAFADDAPIAIHVSSTTGSAVGPGTAAAPFATIQQGLAASLAVPAPHPPVYVAVAFSEYTGNLVIPNGASLVGGFDPLTWAPIPGAKSVYKPSNDTPPSATGITQLTTLRNMQFDSRTGSAVPGVSRIAFVCTDCSAALSFIDCDFRSFPAGNGANGADGLDGSDGFDGGNGSGTVRGPGGGGSSPNRGGNGGNGAAGNGVIGEHGFPQNQPGNAGNPGAGGLFSGNLDGSNATDVGDDGNNGANGVAPVAGGLVVAGVWTQGAPGTNGTDAEDGGGGGGGGGGAGVNPAIGANLIGGGGGGGGQGGFGGNRGVAAQNGAASFSLFLFDASPNLNGCFFFALQGGRGGDGGDGGVRGLGGNGGVGALGQSSLLNEAGRGGNGAAGGDGGHGGGGPGGAGGPSYCVYRAGSSDPAILNCLFSPSPTFGAGGAGGQRGTLSTAFAPNGPDGPVGVLFP